MAIPWLLISMCLGYFVLHYASHEKNEVKSIGRIVGAVVMILSLVGVACSVMCLAQKGSCSMMKKMHCEKTMGKGADFCPMK